MHSITMKKICCHCTKFHIFIKKYKRNSSAISNQKSNTFTLSSSYANSCTLDCPHKRDITHQKMSASFSSEILCGVKRVMFFYEEVEVLLLEV